MADITITGDARLDKINKALKETGRQAKAMGGPSQRAGMSILELSRGIEDFAVAGMRGALNNIPGFIMSLGGSMGIAGMATIALVAVNELVKGIDKLATKYFEAKEAAMQSGLDLSMLSVGGERVDALVKKLESARTFLQLLGDETARNEAILSDRSRSMGITENLRVQELSLELERQGVSEVEKRTELLKLEQRILQDRSREEARNVQQQELSVERIRDEIAAQEEAIANYERMREEIVAGVRAAIMRGKELSKFDPKSVSARRGGGSWEAFSPEEAALRKSERIQKEIAAFNATKDRAELQNAEAKAKVAEKRLKELRDALRVQQQDLENEQRILSTTEKEIASQIRLKEIELERAKIKEEMAEMAEITRMEMMREEGAFTRIPDGFMESLERIRNMRIDPSNFLSSSGRTGGSGAEYQNAIGMINYQRQALKFLAEIARNTKDGRTPVWN